jgi:transcriptional regulator with XRE-family HTH domain
MIAQQIAEQIEQMLAAGAMSQREIAAVAGVSRGTVRGIATGKRRRPKAAEPLDNYLLAPDGPPERCPDCGGMVYLPCRLCETRKAIAHSPELRASMEARRRQGFVALGLNLKPAHQERYEEVRRLRREQEKGSAVSVQGCEFACKAKH